MASNILGKLDIHSGGIDLIFPHHNNEIVQATSANLVDDWVTLFLHSGHLNINGQKMAKSLKNFTSIKEFMNIYGIQKGQTLLRLLFLIHSWDKPMEYSPETIKEAIYYDNKIEEYVKYIYFDEQSHKGNKGSLSNYDSEYLNHIIFFKNNVEICLKDNFNTPQIFKDIHSIINKTFSYMKQNYNIMFVIDLRDYIINLLSIFGLNYNIFETGNQDSNIKDVVQISVDFRQSIRNLIISNKSKIEKGIFCDIMAIMDDMRDNKLRQVGIILQDRNKGEGPIWSFTN